MCGCGGGVESECGVGWRVSVWCGGGVESECVGVAVGWRVSVWVWRWGVE